MCKYPLGSGGKRVCTRPLYLLVLRSSRKRSRMKLDGRDSGVALAPVSVSVAEGFIIFDLTANRNNVLVGQVNTAEHAERPGNLSFPRLSTGKSHRPQFLHKGAGFFCCR